MAQINHLGGIRREFHHVKVTGGDIDRPKYEGAMVLFRESLKGKSFIVPQSAGWKYIEPKDNADAVNWDQIEFGKIGQKVHFKQSLMMPPSEWAEDAAAMILAEQMNINSGILLTVGFGLVKCCQQLEITVTPQALAQLLLFIQDGLSQLRTMPLHIPEEEHEIGEMTVKLNDKTIHVPLTVTETEAKAGLQ